MIKKIIFSACLFFCVAVQAQREKAEAYINTYKELAMSEMIRTGIPASITLAQGILESQSGQSDLAKVSNNHFGIKCKTEWTGAKTYHDDDEKAECFRVYPSAEDSYKDHSEFLKTRPNYAFLFQIDPTDYEGWAKGLKKAGYATSPTYPQKLMKVINDYNLQQYSLLALERKKTGTHSNTVTAALPQPSVGKNARSEQPVKEAVRESEAVHINTDTQESRAVQAARPVAYPQGIFTINHSKVIFVAEGTSLLAMANQFDIPFSKLLEYNDLAETDIADTDRLMFLEKKMKKGVNDFHLVQAGETLHAISQAEGVRLESLLEYNRLNKGAVVSAGDKIYLHPVTVMATQPSGLPK
jgi:hypothetical protein